MGWLFLKNGIKKTKDKGEKDYFEIKGVIMIAIGILSAISIYSNYAGFLSNISQKISYILLGIGGYLLPVVVIYYGYRYLIGHGYIELNKKVYGMGLIIFVLLLTVSTVYIHVMQESPEFISGIKTLFGNDKNNIYFFNGGIVAYTFSYLLYKLIGGIGSYIVYSALLIIGTIITFEISIVNIISENKEKFKKRKKSEAKKVKRTEGMKNKKNNEDFLNIVDKNQGSQDEELLNDVNDKIKILDFMKNSDLDDDTSDRKSVV